MPIYEYQCNLCGHEFETIQKMSEDPLVDCPACSQPGLKKLVSAAAFRLKGQGWYETDFKKDKRKNLTGEGGERKEGDKEGDKKKEGETGKKGEKVEKITEKSEKSGSEGKTQQSVDK